MTIARTDQTASFWSAQHVSILLTILASALWTLSITQAKLNIGFYGLIHSFPVTFLLALVLLTIASGILWVSRENHGKLLCLQLCLLITALWLSPILLGSNPVFANIGYRDYPLTDYIIRYGHINTALALFLYWPGNWIMQAALTEITGREVLSIVTTVGPFLMQFLTLLPLYLLLKNTISNANYRWAAAWIFYLANWTGQIYVGAQGIGLFLLLTLLALLTKPGLREKAAEIGDRLATLLVMAGIVVIHLLTSLAAFASVALLWATGPRRATARTLLVIAAVFIAAWTVYVAAIRPEWSRQLIQSVLERAFRLDLIFQIHFVEHAGASPSHAAVDWVRVSFSALFTLTAITGIVLSLKFKDKADRSILALIAVPIVVLLSGLYGWEALMRAYLFALVPIAYFGVRLLNHKAGVVILCLLLLIAIPLNLVAHYGNAAIDYIPAGEIAYWDFVQDNIGESYLTGGPDFIGFNGCTNVDFSQLHWEDDMLVGEALKNDRPHYVNVGKYDQSMYEFLYNDSHFIPETQAHLDSSIHYNLIYVNLDLGLYMSEDERAR
jgi:hypothetical protein